MIHRSLIGESSDWVELSFLTSACESGGEWMGIDKGPVFRSS